MFVKKKQPAHTNPASPMAAFSRKLISNNTVHYGRTGCATVGPANLLPIALARTAKVREKRTRITALWQHVVLQNRCSVCLAFFLLHRSVTLRRFCPGRPNGTWTRLNASPPLTFSLCRSTSASHKTIGKLYLR